MAIGDTVYESNTTENGYGIGVYAGVESQQTFTPQASHVIYKVRLKLTKTGSPTGNITVSILGAGGVVLCDSAPIAMSTITDSLYTFTFTTNPTLRAGGVYTMSLVCTGGDVSNWIGIRVYNSATVDIYPRGVVIGVTPYCDWYFVECGDVSVWTWTERMTDANRNWSCVASSADGTKLVAGVGVVGGGKGYLYTSTDSGATWTARMTDVTRWWVAVASSADGTKLVALAGAGYAYTSTDSGVTWTPRIDTVSGGSAHNWGGAASSADGSGLLISTSGWYSSGRLYISTNYGVTWAPVGQSGDWMGVAMSADGVKLAAEDDAAAPFNAIFTSGDGGATWTQQNQWARWAIDCSSDGSVILASTSDTYASFDSGVTWSTVLQGTASTSALGCSSDGICFATADKYIHISIDSGATWQTEMSDISRAWLGLAVSTDMSQIVAVAYNGHIWIGTREVPVVVVPITHSFPWVFKFQLCHKVA